MKIKKEEKNETPSIAEIKILGLYGIYNHEISINPKGVTIIHGPNGIGKTAILKCIKNFVSRDFDALSKIPFKNMEIGFTNGTTTSISKIGVSEKDLKNREISLHGEFEVSTYNRGKKSVNKVVGYSDEIKKFAYSIANSRDYYIEIGDGVWHDMRNNKLTTIRDILDIYIPRHQTLISSSKNKKTASTPNEPYEKLDVKLIDTNRLNRIGKSNDDEKLLFNTIEDCAADLTLQIKQATAAYGKKSQELDQSFPHRLIAEEHEKLSKANVSDRLSILEEKQKNLSALGLLAAFEGPLLPTNIASLSGPKLEAISLFIQDSEVKLEELATIARKCGIFLDILSRKFKNKSIKINREKGIYVIGADRTPLPLTALSSGEQHEVILNYELLFRTSPNALVLIDEPEISLHVSWQRNFISDLLQISEAVGFDSIIATHSPFIVNEHLDLLVDLNEEEPR